MALMPQARPTNQQSQPTQGGAVRKPTPAPAFAVRNSMTSDEMMAGLNRQLMTPRKK